MKQPGRSAFMAQTHKSTAFFCHRCKRKLRNTGAGKHRDTVSFTEKKDVVRFRHDGCGGSVSAG